LGEDIRAHTLRRSFCTFVAESDVAPNEAAALTGHTEAVWWKDYVQPRRDAESRRDTIAKLAARGLGVATATVADTGEEVADQVADPAGATSRPTSEQ
jgi:hypothetical protein